MCICHVAKLFSFVDLALINYLAKPIVAQVVGYTTTNDYIYPAQVGCVNVVSGNGQLATYGIGAGRQQPTSQLILCTKLGSCELTKVLKIISVQFIFLFFLIACYYFVDQFLWQEYLQCSVNASCKHLHLQFCKQCTWRSNLNTEQAKSGRTQ